jgi:hypothetical protein
VNPLKMIKFYFQCVTLVHNLLMNRICFLLVKLSLRVGDDFSRHKRSLEKTLNCVEVKIRQTSYQIVVKRKEKPKYIRRQNKTSKKEIIAGCFAASPTRFPNPLTEMNRPEKCYAPLKVSIPEILLQVCTIFFYYEQNIA